MAQEKLDCLLIHAPKSLGEDGGYAMFMAMGLLALADWLERHGYSARILHLGVEKTVDPDFSVEWYLGSRKVGLVGISLHWHYQSLDAVRLAAAIKAVRPDIPVVLGGYTASFFAGDILRDHAAVDFVVRGDGETPLLRLTEQLSSDAPDFSAVPNLSWRRGEEILHNPLGYVAGRAEMEQLYFSNFGLMEHFSVYTRTPLSVPYYAKELLNDSATFFLCAGRGCPVSCTFCGGGRSAQRIINGREGYVFRPVAGILETVRDAAAAGVNCLYVCFDPDPDRRYYLELFAAIRQAGIDVSMVFECWSLPDAAFLEAFRVTFGGRRGSRIVLSPDTGVERLRREHRGFFFTNEDLLAVLRQLKRDGIFAEVYFTYPLPGETLDDVEETNRFIGSIEQEMGDCGHVSIQDFGYDPGSPLYFTCTPAPAFADYCRRHDEAQLTAGIPAMYGGWIRRAEAATALSRAKALKKLARYQEAAGHARQALKAEPGEWDTYMLLGSCLELAGEADGARQVYREAMDHFPSIVI